MEYLRNWQQNHISQHFVYMYKHKQQILLHLWPLHKCIYQPSRTESSSGFLPSICSCLKSSHSFLFFFITGGFKWYKPYHPRIAHTIICILLFLFLYILFPSPNYAWLCPFPYCLNFVPCLPSNKVLEPNRESILCVFQLLDLTSQETSFITQADSSEKVSFKSFCLQFFM